MSTPKLKPGMKLFVPGTNAGKFFHLHSAVLTAPISSPLPGAFKLAADMIIKEHIDAKESHSDRLLFPVLYLYRHCMELKLKALLLLGIRTGFFTGVAADVILDESEGIIGQHRLSALWNKAKEFLAHSYKNDPQITIAESMINDLHQIDIDGQTLRYDREKGTLRLRRPKFEQFGEKQPHPVYRIPETIDIANLRQSMDCLFAYLVVSYDGILDWWDACQQAKD